MPKTDLAAEVIRISKQYGDVAAVRNVSISLQAQSILALVGPSGCGKTSVLRLIAGFEKADSGTITLANQLVQGPKVFVPPEKRGVSLVFQDYALFPHLTVFENVAFGLSRKNKRDFNEKANSSINLVGLGNKGNKYPHQLSGGERQRVALARALAPRPVLILLDEPFSNLDADRRLKMREEVRVILRSTHASAIFVTHDQEEALYMGDSLAVMNSGKIEQIGPPEFIFNQPQSRFVAEFMGDTDFLPGVVAKGGIQTELGLLKQESKEKIGRQIELALRADDIEFSPKPGSKSIILARHYRGGSNFYRLRLPSGHLLHASKSHQEIFAPGTPVTVKINPGHELPIFLDGKNISIY